MNELKEQWIEEFDRIISSFDELLKEVNDAGNKYDNETASGDH